jgi:hypothetical protein
MQSMPIITKVVSSNPTHGKVYSTQHYVKQLICQWLVIDRLFSSGTLVASNNYTDRHFITEILLKVALNTIILKNNHIFYRSEGSLVTEILIKANFEYIILA